MRRTTEQMLSGLADAMERDEAAERGMTVKELRAFRRSCRHDWDERGAVGVCRNCGEGRA